VAKTGISALTLGALGVVFGDIGTSPLYAVQAVFTADHHSVHVNQPEVYGVISLVFWSITMIVSVKYVSFIMRADNGGEGGIMALTALLMGSRPKRSAVTVTLVTLGILGASLFYGDGVITPAISVLSAVEGLNVAVPSLSSLVLPITVAVLCMLFAIQQFGTKLVGNLFGPVMAVWFGILALVGAIEIAHHSGILRALLPTYGAQFILNHGTVAFIALASVVLAVTGAEALYADMGHFGRRPIRRAWFLFVFPALTLNYLAQGSLILRRPDLVSRPDFNPFFQLLPGWAQIPMVLLATVATVIASQAVISGAFSVTQQAVQLGFLPRVAIRHTSEKEVGQIYVPAVNIGMFVTVIAIVITFGSATALASAYGVAVTGTFILNTILFLAVARLLWHKPWKLIALGGFVFLTVEIAFFTANLTKIVHGGWLPLAIALVVFTVLMTWHKGRDIVTANRTTAEGSLRDFIEQIGSQDFPVRQVSGLAVFLNPNLETTPLALRANVEHNRVMHKDVIIVSVINVRVPHVPAAERAQVDARIMFSGATGDPLDIPAERITAVALSFGFLDEPDIPAALRRACEQHLIEGAPDFDRATYFLSQITIVPTKAPGMSAWRKKIFVTMSRNAANPAEYFRLPDNHTVTMSGRVQL
jgi:KUP system potassium uptake protein